MFTNKMYLKMWPSFNLNIPTKCISIPKCLFDHANNTHKMWMYINNNIGLKCGFNIDTEFLYWCDNT